MLWVYFQLNSNTRIHKFPSCLNTFCNLKGCFGFFATSDSQVSKEKGIKYGVHSYMYKLGNVIRIEA